MTPDLLIGLGIGGLVGLYFGAQLIINRNIDKRTCYNKEHAWMNTQC